MTEADVVEVMGPPHSKSIIAEDGRYSLFWHVWRTDEPAGHQAGHIKDQATVHFASDGLVDEAYDY